MSVANNTLEYPLFAIDYNIYTNRLLRRTSAFYFDAIALPRNDLAFVLCSASIAIDVSSSTARDVLLRGRSSLSRVIRSSSPVLRSAHRPNICANRSASDMSVCIRNQLFKDVLDNCLQDVSQCTEYFYEITGNSLYFHIIVTSVMLLDT